MKPEREISNKYDYSNIIVNAENVGLLIQGCEALYNQLMNLINEDEKRNEMLKYELRNYNYKKNYNTGFNVNAIDKERGYRGMLEFDSYEKYNKAVQDKLIIGIEKLTITLNLSYKAGHNDSLVEYSNEFIMIFEPYNIRFERKSNHDEEYMNQVEEYINKMFNIFPVQNTIFCTK